MTRDEMIEALAEYFGIERNEDGDFDLNDYDWQAGSYTGNRDRNGENTWLSLANVVSALEDLCDDDDDDDFWNTYNE